MDAAGRDLIERVGKIAVARPHGTDALHRPLLLLWAFGQAVRGAPRLQRWSVIQRAVGDLLERYADTADARQATVYPFTALRNGDLWDVPDWHDLTITSNRRPTLESLDRVDPLAGLPQADYDLIAADRAVAAKAAALLIIRYINPRPPGLLESVGLGELLGDNHQITAAMRPAVGERFKDRRKIYNAYGGQWLAGIGALGDGYLCIFSDEKGPYSDSRIADTDWIAYVGEGLNGDQHLSRGNKTLEEYQREQRAVRFWHKPNRGEFTFETWAVVVQRRKRWGIGDDGVPRREFVWILAPVESPLRDTWPKEVTDALDEDSGDTHDETGGLSAADFDPSTSTNDRARYKRLADAARKNANMRRGNSKPSVIARYVRSEVPRKAVLIRSGGKCENPGCLGHPDELTDAGDPILEVDHVNDIAKGGWDTTDVMIALCPNCHALKTRGRNSKQLRTILLKQARELDAAWRAP